ncbi:MAG: diacylglycerol kinase family lipid kinase [Mediterranea sp.]|jgi:YegS/Rv2252/BmrU family lipid kinase|nr:diacylglycerol kinase family lipid kinase [Mediterranea sp.]
MNENQRKILFVVNPISGTQSKDAILGLLDDKLDKERYSSSVVYTERAGHAVEIAAKAAEDGCDVVVAIGGDGTINEVARSLVHTHTALGIIPCGSGNGLARHLHIPMDAKKALEILNDGYIETIDYGRINGRDFFCTCGLGFDAFVSFKFAHAGKRGLLTYLETTLQEVLHYRPETYELQTENGSLQYKAFLIACGNASQYGNNAYITPHATLTDGLMDVTILQPFTVLDVPSLAYQLFNKTIDQNSRIKTFRCQKLHIHREQPGVIHFDGDPVQTDADVDIELIGKGLRVVVPSPEREKASTSMLQKAHVYVNDSFKELHEAIMDNITDTNRKIMRKLTKKS